MNFVDENDDNIFNVGDQLLSDFTYTVREDGRRTPAVENLYDGNLTHSQTFTWQYDGLGRLVSESLVSDSLDDYVDTFTYDLVGNRTQLVHDNLEDNSKDRTVSYDYDINDRLISEQSDGTSEGRYTVYEYDNTQQTRKTVHEGLSTNGDIITDTTYRYNVQGRLDRVEIESDSGSSGPENDAEYEYDDQGVRVSQAVDGAKSLYLIDHHNHTGYAQVLEEVLATQSNMLANTYVLGHDVLQQLTLANGLASLIADGHGSTRQLVDALGVPLEDSGQPQVYTYNAYGEQLEFTGTPLTNLLYSGEQTDRLTGMQYLRARYYDPSTGRFNRLDPFAGDTSDPQSLHKYLYTHGDPVNGIVRSK